MSAVSSDVVRKWMKMNVSLGQTPGEIINMILVYIMINSKLNPQQFWLLIHNLRDGGNCVCERQNINIYFALPTLPRREKRKYFFGYYLTKHIHSILFLCLHRRTLKWCLVTSVEWKSGTMHWNTSNTTNFRFWLCVLVFNALFVFVHDNINRRKKWNRLLLLRFPFCWRIRLLM